MKLVIESNFILSDSGVTPEESKDLIKMKLNELFRKFAIKVSVLAGTPWAFFIALATIVFWAISGPVFNFSNRWQLAINTGTTIVTLLMVFIIQNTQNRDSKALHIKLDELLRSLKGTSHDKYLKVEELPDEKIEELQEHFRKLHNRYEVELTKRRKKNHKN
jgi:low affinity Fe/Cu permease